METKELNPFMYLHESGELKLEPDILRNLNKQLCKLTKCDTVDYSRIKQESKTRIKTESSHYDDVFSVPKGVVKQWARSMSLVSVPGLYSDLDLERGKYEGGFKVWESTGDLVKFVTQDQSLMPTLLHSGSGIRVLELGAGAALPSLALLGRLIKDPVFHSSYRIHLQDYNWQVLASLTLMNFAVNLPEDYLRALIDTKCLRFFYGDWKHFRRQSNYKYDLIMMSEVIYNSDSYDALHELLDKHLKSNGHVVIATKDTYFGLSGGLYSWIDYLDTRNVFHTHRVIRVTTTNIPRSVLIMKRLRN